MKLPLRSRNSIFIWLIGIIVALGSFQTVQYYESRRHSDQLQAQFDSKFRSLEQSLGSIENLLYSTRSFLLNANSPSQQQFEQYLTQRTGIGSIVHSVLWLPTIPASQVEQLRKSAKDNGFLAYSLSPSLEEQPQCDQVMPDTTFPVLYVSSIFEASDYLGIRFDTHPSDAKAMNLTYQNNAATVSTISMDGQDAARVFLPVIQNDRLQGFVAANIILHELLGVTWSEQINSNKLNITVRAKETQHTLFQSHLNIKLSDSELFEQIFSMSKLAPIPLFNQQWWFEISMVDRSGSIVLYGGSAVFLVLLLTVVASLAENFYRTRLQVSDQVIQEKTHTLALQALQDNLTGMYNRQALNNEVDQRLTQLRTDQIRGFSILFIDLDRFKLINDSMGHLLGDEVLIQVAQRLSNNCRNGDLCFRFGGDEFVICLPEQIYSQALSQISHRYASVLSQPYLVQDQRCHIGASIGISVVTDHQQNLASILREADTAMYHAKNSTQDKVMFFHDGMFKRAKQRFELEQDLAVAIDLNQLSIVYQPIYATDTDRVTGFEALLRWNHPEKGMISPDEFIPMAEETGLIIKVGDWVLKKTCQTLNKLWKSNQLELLPRFNINVSAKQFESEHIYHSLLTMLDQYDFPARFIGIEITESLLLSHAESSRQVLDKIKALGCVIYLDDFGTGYSSLSVLNDYPVDVVKVDRSFVQGIARGNSTADNLCKAIIDMSHTIDMAVVAEGVESHEQLAQLAEYGCNYVQGYLKSKPVSACQLLPVIHGAHSHQPVQCKQQPKAKKQIA
ncbi:putative bifunctional diguanylate cyclase/phosphodiesterase [Vibrio paucivorans]|uniref:EAL domain-containing protein n=1 Tax=Vibrio paucivorans TaxID=2829489 RepID=A0A9X3CCY9_9VIBR|nr:EAL domain-containing protein [Vibrio paucivorans]MCW8333423.1 EAL domain-containing protein [Vibrio paucivorans]